ncbi:MAG TPA: hypothetical protein VJL86_09870 [Steroidobacteraceae bacterium]|nr:hypothetical protein [Steroidobacteraceae bacterium]
MKGGRRRWASIGAVSGLLVAVTLGSVAEARLATNRLASNRLASNRLASNALVLERTAQPAVNPFQGLDRQAIAR